MKIIYTISALIVLFCVVNSDRWAVLIAGSNSWFNYRHQSDVCHAYQILTKLGGFPKDNIITMMYNDIAYNNENPYPGQIFNYPNGSNVYNNVRIDYQGNNVTAEHFIAVLKGNDSAVPHGLPVLKSKKNDDVFIYYSDHGATGIVAMPYGPPLYANDLNNALNYMYQHNMYKNLLFYLEACESGSMFNNILKTNTNIFATTAATPDESSYAIYYNETIGTYLADEYSIDWMMDTINYWNDTETLLTQYNDLTHVVKQSHPQKYGDLNIDNDTVKEFQSYKDNLLKINNEYGNQFNPYFIPNDSVNSRNVKLYSLQNKWLNTNNENDKEYYQILIEREISLRVEAELIFTELIELIVHNNEYINDSNDIDALILKYMWSYPNEITEWKCLKDAYNLMNNECMKFNDFSIQFTRVLVNICENIPMNIIVRAINDLCN